MMTKDRFARRKTKGAVETEHAEVMTKDRFARQKTKGAVETEHAEVMTKDRFARQKTKGQLRPSTLKQERSCWETTMPFKFEKLEVWQLALEYNDLIYAVASQLPKSEEFNLKSQIVRAATSVAQNIAEGSTSQTDAEQARFLGLAIRSLLETVACQHLISRRQLLAEPQPLRDAYSRAEILAAKLHAMRHAISPDKNWLREPDPTYITDDSQFTGEL